MWCLCGSHTCSDIYSLVPWWDILLLSAHFLPPKSSRIECETSLQSPICPTSVLQVVRCQIMLFYHSWFIWSPYRFKVFYPFNPIFLYFNDCLAVFVLDWALWFTIHFSKLLSRIVFLSPQIFTTIMGTSFVYFCSSAPIHHFTVLFASVYLVYALVFSTLSQLLSITVFWSSVSWVLHKVTSTVYFFMMMLFGASAPPRMFKLVLSWPLHSCSP